MAVRNGASGLYQEDYGVNNVVDSNPLYVGKVTPTGKWLVMRYNLTTGDLTYANLSNNAGVTTYLAAWATYAALTYDRFEVLTGV